MFAEPIQCSVQFSPLTYWVVRGDMKDDSAQILFQSFLQEALVSSFGRGTVIVSIQHFLCRRTASPTLQDALKDDLGKAVMACDMPKSCKLPSLDSCHKRLLWTHKEVDLAPHQVVGLVPVSYTHLTLPTRRTV